MSESAMDRYKECCGPELESPLERLRFFCSQAMNGDDWLDSEQFFDDLERHIAASPVLVGELVDVEDDCGTIMATWNDARWKLPAGTLLYAVEPKQADVSVNTSEQSATGNPASLKVENGN